MGERIRSYDWSSHPLGAPAGWPQALKTVLRLLLSTGHPMFIWWGPELYQFYNDAYRRSIGPEQHPTALGQRGRECWDEIWDIIGPQIDLVMAGRGHTWHENQLVPITRYGQREDVYWTYSYGPIDDPGAATGVGGVLVVCTETTEQVLAEQRMREAEARWRSLFEQSPGFVCILEGPDHVFAFANERYFELVGGRELIGKPIREAIPEMEGQGFLTLLDEVYRSGKRHRGTSIPVRLQRERDGGETDGGETDSGETDSGETEVFVDFLYQPIEDAAGEVVGVFVDGYDVTARIAAHRRLRREDRKKDEFLAMLAHELRNPLAPIRNASELLILSNGEEMDARRIGEMLERQVTQITRLVDDLLDVSRITRDRVELDQEPLKAEGLLAQAVESVKPQLAKKGHEVIVSIDGDTEPAWIQGDRVRLVQSISNLLTNASKYTPADGEIELRLRGDGDRVVIDVVDSGIGISEDMKGQVFELFTQADQSLDRAEGGLGVGLFVVRQLVEMHGGDVQVISDGLGHGATFRIRLPACPAAPARGETSPAPDPQAQRILVVDDIADVADSLVELLRLKGHQAESVQDPYEAIERVLATSPSVVLLDIGLPGIDGYEVARSLRAEGSDSLLVALTGYGRDEDVERAREAGFDAHLTKPVAFDKLDRALDMARGGKGSPSR